MRHVKPTVGFMHLYSLKERTQSTCDTVTTKPNLLESRDLKCKDKIHLRCFSNITKLINCHNAGLHRHYIKYDKEINMGVH